MKMEVAIRVKTATFTMPDFFLQFQSEVVPFQMIFTGQPYLKYVIENSGFP